jgi:hypothetical protein
MFGSYFNKHTNRNTYHVLFMYIGISPVRLSATANDKVNNGADSGYLTGCWRSHFELCGGSFI